MGQNESQEGEIMSASPVDVETNEQADALASNHRWVLPGPKSDDLTAHLVARMGTIEFGMGRMIGSIERLDSRIDDQSKIIDAMSRRLDGRLDEMDRRLTGRIDELGRRLDGRIDELGQRLDGRIDDLTRRMDRGFEHVDVRFDILSSQLQKLTDVVSDLVSWKQRIWGICLAASGLASIAGLLWALVKRIIPA